MKTKHIRNRLMIHILYNIDKVKIVYDDRPKKHIYNAVLKDLKRNELMFIELNLHNGIRKWHYDNTTRLRIVIDKILKETMEDIKKG